MKKIIIGIIIILIVIFGTYLVYLGNEAPDDTNRITLNVSGSPLELSKVIEEIETDPYFEGYDNETVKWMKSLGSKYVYISLNEIIIMDYSDASKLRTEDATDVYIEDIFSCRIVENHTLGTEPYKDVLYVKDVEFIRENITYYEV
ncbi:MAG: hypothetical protein IJQ68_09355 [Methanobrevibacter sp.]|uniref:hypothetical protein n=1 Tax=Methanobrevibacter sp. TaxID=66852 RepID=UPI0025FDA3DA|nr:hypothetical protein [Methanobrevibacter sp.]MBR0272173.1 hypothetical protein [Methanobrevibacter sp.]